jgi:hypothetical protein
MHTRVQCNNIYYNTAADKRDLHTLGIKQKWILNIMGANNGF